jgi:RNA polymerase sigma factor (sigma-70 family)
MRRALSSPIIEKTTMKSNRDGQTTEAQESARPHPCSHGQLADNRPNRKSHKHLDDSAFPRSPAAVKRRSLVKSAWRRSRRKRSGSGSTRRGTASLSRAEEMSLAARIQRGDAAARDRLIDANLNLVREIVNDFKHRGVPLEDLIQEGNLGLIEAAQRFNPRSGTTSGKAKGRRPRVGSTARFASYATFWIRAYMKRAVASESSLVRLPEHTRRLRERCFSVMRYPLIDPEASEITSEANRLDSDDLSRISGFSRRQLKRLEINEFEITSLSELLEDPRSSGLTPDLEAIEREEAVYIDSALACLYPFEAWVISQRYGVAQAAPQALEDQCALDDDAETSMAYFHRTHQDIANDCGLTRHHIRSIEQRALKKLREDLRTKRGPKV